MSDAVERRVENLKLANERKSADAHRSVLDTIGRMRRDGHRINVNAVARAAGVSRGFIYAHDDLRTKVEQEAERARAGLRRATPTASEKSLSARLTTALDAIVKLKAENEALERRIENLTAQLFERGTDVI